jgi:hypothetical protein
MTLKTRKRAKSRKTRRRRAEPEMPPVEIYTPQRMAEFLLSNTADADDYSRACKLVRQKLGLDPAKIRHYKPAGVA